MSKWYGLFENNPPRTPTKGTDNIDIVPSVSALAVRVQGNPSKIADQRGDTIQTDIFPKTLGAGTDNLDIVGRDSFIAGLDEHERIAYGELTEIMTSKTYWAKPETAHYRLTPEMAHMTAKGIIDRYRNNQRERAIHAKAS